MPPEIPNAALHLEHLPAPQAPLRIVEEFALTFNGYVRWPDSPSCGEVAKQTMGHFKQTGRFPQDLDLLRSCLFFEQRRWRHYGDLPEGDDLSYIYALVEAIRNLVQTR